MHNHMKKDLIRHLFIRLLLSSPFFWCQTLAKIAKPLMFSMGILSFRLTFLKGDWGFFVAVTNAAVWIFFIMEKKSETERQHIPLAHGSRGLSILMNIVFLSGMIYHGTTYQEQIQCPELDYLYDPTSN